MKKCPVCGTGKARRLCARHDGVEVCSQCCAASRGEDCGDCVHYGAAEQHRSARTTRAAMAEGEFLIEISPETEEAVDGAMELAERGEFKQAREILSRLHREKPRNHTVCFGFGALHAMQNELPQAIEWFDKALAIYPYMAQAHYNRAVAYQEQMDLPKCIRAFRKVVEFGDREAPETVKSREMLETIDASLRGHYRIGVETFLASSDAFNQAFDFMERSAWQQAADHFRKSIALNGRIPSAHGNLGLCYANLGLKAEALAAFDRALELDPRYEPARINREAAEKMEEGRPLENVTSKTIDSNQERYSRSEQE